MSLANKEVTLTRDCEAVLIPSGDPITLQKDTRGYITQTLGGSYTVNVGFGLVRIAGENADALGLEQEAPAGPEIESDGPVTEEMVFEQLKTCFDPEIPVNIVDLGLVYSCSISELENGKLRVDVQMTLTAPGCGMGPAIAADAESKVKLLPNVEEAEVSLVWDPPWTQDMITEEGKMTLGMI
ncbi:MAG TPA: putative Fe-S cluster assembly protein SufT [Opitutales bacterium]|nr:putative Fe-S cluster assembly protein SufT [Opitutales bacterium]